jgi:hypothetical protein
VVSQVGDGVSKLTLLWFVYSVTGSPLKTRIIGILQTAPSIVLAPFIGVAVDRLPQKTLLILSDLIRIIPLCVGDASCGRHSRLRPDIDCRCPIAGFPIAIHGGQCLAANHNQLGHHHGASLQRLGHRHSQEVLCINAARPI